MANSLASRLARIMSILVPPDVFLGKRQMTEFEVLRTKLRHCFTCGRPMKWSEFLGTAHVNGDRTKFGLELLQEIWENDVFVINCCACHKDIQRGRRSDVLDAMSWALPEYMQNPVV